jgi:hypothetical protein
MSRVDEVLDLDRRADGQGLYDHNLIGVVDEPPTLEQAW